MRPRGSCEARVGGVEWVATINHGQVRAELISLLPLPTSLTYLVDRDDFFVLQDSFGRGRDCFDID